MELRGEQVRKRREREGERGLQARYMYLSCARAHARDIYTSFFRCMNGAIARHVRTPVYVRARAHGV